jgi:two-component system phosphate regulon sensor histidine kinase PhoR
MDEITQKLKSLILILNQSRGFSFINQSAINSLGWSLDDLNKNFPNISRLSSNLTQLEKLINSIFDGCHETNSSYQINRQELEIFGQAYNCYFQKLDADYVLELNPIIYQDLNQATHEFKRPIQNIKTLVEVLIMGAKNDSTKLDEYLAKLNTEADRLAVLVNDMLSLSRLNSGFQELQKSSVNLQQMIKNIFSNLANFASSKEIDLQNLIPSDFLVDADKKLLEHALINLIDNAIKYNVNKGFIKVYIVKDDLIIEDSGLGMTKDDTKKVFEQFYRIPDRLHIQGSGLGLSLVKKIIDLHGWAISVESEQGKGTKFIINLPRNRT